MTRACRAPGFACGDKRVSIHYGDIPNKAPRNPPTLGEGACPHITPPWQCSIRRLPWFLDRPPPILGGDGGIFDDSFSADCIYSSEEMICALEPSKTAIRAPRDDRGPGRQVAPIRWSSYH